MQDDGNAVKIEACMHAEALRDLLFEVSALARAVKLDDDQDPALDSPVERVSRAFGRFDALCAVQLPFSVPLLGPGGRADIALTRAARCSPPCSTCGKSAGRP